MAETTTIRGLDRELYKQAKANAVLEGKPLSQWLNEAMKDKLDKIRKKEARNAR